MSTIAEKISKLSPEQRALLEQKLLTKHQSKRQFDQNLSRITPRADQSIYPLSAGQQHLWTLEQMAQASSAYNITDAFHLKGALDVECLSQSLAQIASRHDTLRARFETVDGAPIQFVEPEMKVDITHIDLSTHATADRLSHAAYLATNSDNQTFDLAAGPLWRVTLAHLAEDEKVLIFTIHHMIADGWSLDLFMEELSHCYATLVSGAQIEPANLPIQYADYAAWQSAWLADERAAKQLAYWSKKLDRLTEPLTLPISKREGVAFHSGQQANRIIPQSLIDAAQQLCQQNDISLFVFLLSAFQATLYRYTAQQEMVVCTPIVSRSQLELEKLIGYFNNIVALRSSLTAETTFDDLLHKNKQVVLDAYEHQDFPFQLITELPSLTRIPLSRALLVLADSDGPVLNLPGVEVDILTFTEDSADFDWSLFLNRTPNGLRCELVYKSGLFDEEVITSFLQDYQQVIAQLVSSWTSSLASITIDGKYQPNVSLDPVGIVDSDTYEEPINEYERDLAAIWSSVLGIKKIGRNQNFFELGGHSMAAVRLFAQIRDLTGDNLPLSTLFESPTIKLLAKRLTTLQILAADEPANTINQHRHRGICNHTLSDIQSVARGSGITSKQILTETAPRVIDNEWTPLVMINRGSEEKKPFYCVHGAGGNVLIFRELARQLGSEVPFYGLQAQGVDGLMRPHSTIAEIADCYLKAILSHQPTGPYRLGGYSGGGIVALEIAQRLQRRGASVDVLAMIDTQRPDLEEKRVSLSYHMQHLSKSGTAYIAEWVKERIDYRRLAKKQADVISNAIDHNKPIPIEARDWHLTTSFWAALDKHQLTRYNGDVMLFAAEEVWVTLKHLGDDKGWREVIPNLTVQSVPGDHETLVSGENVNVIAQWLRSRLT